VQLPNFNGFIRDIKPQLLVGLAMDDLMIVQEFWVSLLLGSQKGNHFLASIKHIETTREVLGEGLAGTA